MLPNWQKRIGNHEPRFEIFLHGFCQARANVDARDESDRTPLFEAVGESWLQLARLLVQRKADVNVADAGVRTPLHVAASAGYAGLQIRSKGKRFL